MTSKRPPSIIRERQKHLAARRDPNSMVASAAVMTGTSKSGAKIATADWQNKAWQMYDEVGELRFATSWISNALSRVNMVAAAAPASQGDEPSPIDLTAETGVTAVMKRAVELTGEIAGGPAGQGQMLGACAKLLTVPGVGYVYARADQSTDTYTTWRTLSNDEVKKGQGDELMVADADTGEWTAIGANDLLLKVWRQHPRRSWEADSPVRAVLPVLEEIKLLTSRIAADARSRLAGNGLLLLPEEAEFPDGQGVDVADDADDPFIETFVQVTQIPITDQSSPAATTPLVVRMPGEYVDKAKHLTFWSDLSSHADELRQAAIKRLALGFDMPPEVLLGMGETNHWTAWQVEETAITLNIEPLAEVVCHALTIGFLRPALIADGYTTADADTVMVWYETTDLTTRPDRSGVAAEAHARLKISDAAYLREIGLDVTDMPDAAEFKTRVLLDVAKGAPTMAPAMLAAAGILEPEVADAAATAPTTDPAPAPAAPAADEPPADGPPERSDTPPASAATLALVAAADGMVYRALERAGARLRSAATKGQPGGAAAIPCLDVTTLHCSIEATRHAPLDTLLDGAWDRVPTVAARYHVSPESLTACLDGYVRGLIASGHAHDLQRLEAALGVWEHDGLVIAAH